MNHQLKFAVSIAHDVREWTEQRAWNRHDRTNRFELCGYCAIASARLYRNLKAYEIDSTICVAELNTYAHAFVLVDDHIIDVTATQFREFTNQRVVVLHQKEAEAYEFYVPAYYFKSAYQLRKWQIAEEWPREQIAFDR